MVNTPTAKEFCVCGNIIEGEWDASKNAVVFDHLPCSKCGSFNRRTIDLGGEW